MRKICFIGYGLGGGQPTGVQRYTLEILNALDDLVNDGEVDLLIHRDEQADFHFRHIRVVRVGFPIVLPGVPGEKIRHTLYRNLDCRRYIRKEHALSVDLNLQYPRFGCDLIAIHDCMPEKFRDPDQNKMDGLNRRRQKRILRALDRAKRIVTVSDSSREDIRHIFHPGKEIVVIPNAWQHMERIREEDSVLERFGLRKGSYFFSLGSMNPHKNFKWIICAARQNPDAIFISTGLIPAHAALPDTNDLPDNMIFTGYLADGEVKSLMKYCRAFIQPSLGEGFGIPPMEAMSVGADCIVSNRPALPEIYRDSVWYIDPENYTDINMSQIMSRPKESNEKILNRYSWSGSAKALLKVLEKINDVD